MAQLTIEIPEASPDEDPEAVRKDYIYGAVAKWYDMGLISQGRGAEILGIGREEFIFMLAKYDVCAIQVHPEDYDEEFGGGV